MAALSFVFEIDISFALRCVRQKRYEESILRGDL